MEESKASEHESVEEPMEMEAAVVVEEVQLSAREYLWRNLSKALTFG